MRLLQQAEEGGEYRQVPLGEAPGGAFDMRLDWLNSRLLFLVADESGDEAVGVVECSISESKFLQAVVFIASC